jgi:hypothetical protein
MASAPAKSYNGRQPACSFGQYVEMKHLMGVSFGLGTQVLDAFKAYSGDILLGR